MTNPHPDPPPSEPKITAALVDRVSERLALGMPLRLALAGEPVTRAEYKEHLLRHPELQVLQDLAKRKFLENAFSVMLEGENAAASYRWLIELAYPEVGNPSDDDSAKKKPTILGLPEDLIDQIRQNAKRL